jgi:hypothetical protein
MWKNAAALTLTPILLIASACSESVTSPAAEDLSDLVVPPSYALIGGGAWSATGPGSTLTSDGSSGDPSMQYAVHAWSGAWSLRSTATQSGPTTVSYQYTGFHSWCGATVFIRAFIIRAGNSTSTQLAYYQDACAYQYPSGGFNETGSFTFDLQPGDVFGFEFGGSHGDSNYYLGGTFTITQPIVDSDGDGVPDDQDAFPSDPSEWEDSDGDGVGDNADAYDNSDLGATVVIQSCNSGVGNHLFGNGATFNDLIGTAYAAANGNHGAFVSAVTKLADGWKKAGLISGREQGAITSCAARSK